MANPSDAPVRCMYLPLATAGLLVPSSSVVEIIVVPPINRVDGAPAWLDGVVNWRGEKLPLVSAEAALGRPRTELGARARIAVIHALEGSAGMRFYGIGIQRLPTVVLASERTTEAAEPSVLVDWVHSQVDLEVGEGLVPNFDILERMVAAAIPAAAH